MTVTHFFTQEENFKAMVLEIMTARSASYALHLVANQLKEFSTEPRRAKTPGRRKEMENESYQITQLARRTMN